MTNSDSPPARPGRKAAALFEETSAAIGRTTERRGSTRVESSYNAACVLQTVSYNVELLDLSRDGAQIRIRQGLMPSPKSSVSLAFMDGIVHPAHVIWTKDSDCGIRFDTPLVHLDESTHFDDLGADFFKSVLRFQISG